MYWHVDDFVDVQVQWKVVELCLCILQSLCFMKQSGVEWSTESHVCIIERDCCNRFIEHVPARNQRYTQSQISVVRLNPLSTSFWLVKRIILLFFGPIREHVRKLSHMQVCNATYQNFIMIGLWNNHFVILTNQKLYTLEVWRVNITSFFFLHLKEDISMSHSKLF